jgi:hypothetical protein
MRACRDQLLPDGREGAIVPFKSTATWIPMYQGLLKRFRQSGQCRWIGGEVVRKGETFEYFIDQTGPHFRHVPGEDTKADIVKVWAGAVTKDDAFYIAILSREEIDKIKAMSRASREDAPWRMWETEMMKKTALRRLAKLLPAGRDFVSEEDDLPVVEDTGPVLVPAPQRVAIGESEDPPKRPRGRPPKTASQIPHQPPKPRSDPMPPLPNDEPPLDDDDSNDDPPPDDIDQSDDTREERELDRPGPYEQAAGGRDPDFQRGMDDAKAGHKACLTREIRENDARFTQWRRGWNYANDQKRGGT